MSRNLVISSLKFVLVEIIGEILYFPIWWYTKGAKKFFLFFWQKVVVTQRGLGVGVWLANLFRPMYGQTDWQGQIISFIIRIFQIIVRSIVLIIWTLVLILAFLFWLLLPLLVAYQIYQVVINFS
ncbi:MAG: hypothetical protein AAB969_01370 [Patescibacteria group bacterium]